MEEEIYSAIILVSVVVIVLSLGIVLAIINYKRKQEAYLHEKKAMLEEFEKQLLKSQIEVQENTFTELGKELHDNIGQLLSSTKMLLGITQRGLSQVPETLTIAEETLGKAINELRSLSKSLDKEWLEQFDLIENLTAEIARINAAKTLTITFSHMGNLSFVSQEQIILFRIIQEALQNAIKHSGGKNIIISIKQDVNAITVGISDDGRGFQQSLASNGLGMKNMKQRTNLLGGTIVWDSVSGSGSSVIIQLPLKKDYD